MALDAKAVAVSVWETSDENRWDCKPSHGAANLRGCPTGKTREKLRIPAGGCKWRYASKISHGHDGRRVGNPSALHPRTSAFPQLGKTPVSSPGHCRRHWICIEGTPGRSMSFDNP